MPSAATPDSRPPRPTLTRRVRALTAGTVAAAGLAVGALTVALGGTATADTPAVVPTDGAQLDGSLTANSTETLQAPRQVPGATSGRADAGTGGS